MTLYYSPISLETWLVICGKPLLHWRTSCTYTVTTSPSSASVASHERTCQTQWFLPCCSQAARAHREDKWRDILKFGILLLQSDSTSPALGLKSCLHVCLFTTCVPSTNRVKKKTPDLLEVKSQTVVSYHAGARNQTTQFSGRTIRQCS